MSELSITIVEGCHHTGDDLDSSGTDLWGLALDQRAFGPGQPVVVTACRDGAVLGLARELAHCESIELPEFALECCLNPPSPALVSPAVHTLNSSHKVAGPFDHDGAP